MKLKLSLCLVGCTALFGVGSAQIPDLLTALDAGGRAMGLGGSTYMTDATTFSINANPAGLGYLTKPVFGVAYRNMPESRTTIKNDFNNPDFDTSLEAGSFGLSHVGYAMPMGGGTIGFSYTRGGSIRDERVGTDLANGNLTVKDFQETLRAHTDFFTVSFGSNSGGGGSNYGLGIVLAMQYVQNVQRYDLFNGNTQVGDVATDNSSNGMGVGIVAGMMFTPTSNPNTSIGMSAQSPISLSGNSETSGYYDQIPGRFSAGFATRTDGSGRDYTLYGAQATMFFGGQGDKILARDNYTTFGAGVEFGLHRWGGRVPVRFGYSAVPAGGDGFIDRNAITFGLGYRPDGGEYSLDLSFAKPIDGSEFDFALSLTYYTGKK